MGEIVSSTGRLGLEPRPDNRFYLNWPRLVEQPSLIEGYFRRLFGFSNFERDGVSVVPDGRRDIFRGLAGEKVIRELLEHDNLSGAQIEAAFPLPGREDLWYLCVARNEAPRVPLIDINSMYERVRENIRPFNNPVETVLKVLMKEHVFVASISPDDLKTQEELLTLWGDVFGWSAKQISNFAQRLASEDSQHRTVWFSGIKNNNGKLVAASMAELIVFKGRKGEPIRIVESTEWRSEESDHIKACVDVLHTQVFESYQDATIIAECNFHRGAPRAAQKSGMISPDVVLDGIRIPQIHRQNVVVVDGNEPRGLRDFVLYCLHQDKILPSQRREILDLIA